MKTSRRTFIKVIAAGGGALLLGVRTATAREGENAKAFQPNVWLRMERDGTVTILVGKSEMGQGVRTSLPMIVAEELDAKFEQVRIEQASPGADFKRLGTGGSGSIMRSWDSLREAGAAARLMLVAAAAARWSVPASELETEAGAVVHKASKRRLEYGELAAERGKTTRARKAGAESAGRVPYYRTITETP